MQNVAEIADRVFNAQLAAHTSGRTFAQEMKDMRDRDYYVNERTQSILADKDYVCDLMISLIESQKNADTVIYEALWSTSKDYIGKMADFHAAMTKEARKVAESEAKRRWGF